jgi:WD40 repeat protein
MELPISFLCTPIGVLFALGGQSQEPDAAAPAREILVTTPKGAVVYLEPETARIRLRIGTEPCKAFELSPDGLDLARLLYNDTVVLHDARNGEERVRFKALPFVKPPHSPLEWAEEWWDEDRCLRFAGANDRLVLAKGHRATELWSLEPAERVAQLPHEDRDLATAVDVSPDGSEIVTGNDAGQLILWSALDGSRLHAPWQISTKITALHFDPSGQLIAIGSVGCNVHLLDLNDGALRRLEPSRLTGTGSRLGLDDVRFDRTGRQLIAVTNDCSPNVMTWDVSTGELAWERDMPWAGPPVRQSADGERWLLGNRGVWLDAATGSTLAEAFPRGPAGLDTNGDVAWHFQGHLRLFTLGDPVRIRDVRLDP